MGEERGGITGSAPPHLPPLQRGVVQHRDDGPWKVETKVKYQVITTFSITIYRTVFDREELHGTISICILQKVLDWQLQVAE